MRVPERVTRIAGDWRGDLVLALGLSLFLLIGLAAAGLLESAGNWFEALTAVGLFCCLIPRLAHPQLAAVGAAACNALSAIGSIDVIPNGLGNIVAVPVFLLAYSLGTAADQRRSLVALALLLIGLQVGNGVTTFNPIFWVLTIGPWALGLVVTSRRRLTEQLAVRGRELEAERALFAAEAVRYERARIARELHDIVAHCVSVMVIQASAGQRLTATQPSLAAEAFDSIGEVAQQAEAEIGRLLDLLDATGQQRGADGLRLIGELVTRASAAGLAVSCRFSGSADGLPAVAADAAYRVVQESLTNALKHAPGAPVDIVITGTAGQVEIGVRNGSAAGPPSGLERSGAGRGLTGMRERVAACGGELDAGPADGGGWQVIARLPRRPVAADHARS
ncbi:MAG TPA: histidine kinase [Trebonia sp.]|jgi:signal transduction histidine kinase|nr:histidine kinase [Trebonia sp.]